MNETDKYDAFYDKRAHRNAEIDRMFENLSKIGYQVMLYRDTAQRIKNSEPLYVIIREMEQKATLLQEQIQNLRRAQEKLDEVGPIGGGL